MLHTIVEIKQCESFMRLVVKAEQRGRHTNYYTIEVSNRGAEVLDSLRLYRDVDYITRQSLIYHIELAKTLYNDYQTAILVDKICTLTISDKEDK